MDDLKYHLALSLTPYLGPVTARRLISYCGGVKEVFTQKKHRLEAIPGFGPESIQRVDFQKGLQNAEQELEFCQKSSVQIIGFLDNQYPKRLAQCQDAPLVIYLKGNPECIQKKKIIAIVGTRHATYYGKTMVEKIVEEIKERGHDITIISGMAYGVDSIAHRAALKNKIPTAGVLGHGLDKIYPAQHKNLADEILREGGALVTEFGHKSSFEKSNFVRRNRIIAGLSDAVLVAESGITGGALITAEYANGYNRDVFAIPGKVDDQYSAGCNMLIKRNKAALCETFQDIEYGMNWDVSSTTQTFRHPTLFPELTQDEEALYDLFEDDKPVSVDYLTAKLSIPIHQVSSTLLQLEFKGLITALPGNLYRKN